MCLLTLANRKNDGVLPRGRQPTRTDIVGSKTLAPCPQPGLAIAQKALVCPPKQCRAHLGLLWVQVWPPMPWRPTAAGVLRRASCCRCLSTPPRVRTRIQPGDGSGPKAPHHPPGSCRHGGGLRVLARISLSGHAIKWSACPALSSSPRLRRATVFCISSSLAYTSSLVTFSTISASSSLASVVTGAKIAAPSISRSSFAAANSSTAVQASAGLAGAAMASNGERWEGFRKYVCGTQSA